MVAKADTVNQTRHSRVPTVGAAIFPAGAVIMVAVLATIAISLVVVTNAISAGLLVTIILVVILIKHYVKTTAVVSGLAGVRVFIRMIEQVRVGRAVPTILTISCSIA